MEQQDRRVYVTNNSYKILKNGYARLITGIDKGMTQAIYKEDISWIFSWIEIKYLFAEVLVYSNNPDFKLREDLIKKPDSGHLFSSSGPLKYHFKQYCDYAKKSYTNFSIPDEIQRRGPNEINKFRSFAEENKELFETDQDKFLTRLEAQFFLRQRPERISIPNSGVREFSKLSLEEMESVIDESIDRYKDFEDKYPDTKKIKNAPHWKAKDLSLDPQQRDWLLFKKNLNDKLCDYIKKRDGLPYFSKIFLDSLGFVGCKVCGSEPAF
ncbi:hypothetical protein [Halomonas sp. RA08-2]|uniref:hypothetical protein n=1 Tax=Halomonas sp. RA08-2 TaxID=3440842 RepID=UPI003EE83BCC